MKTPMLLLSFAAAALSGAGAATWWAHRTAADHAAMPAGASAPGAAAASTDPSTWTVQQGEAATRRHLAQGLKAGDVDPATGSRILYYQDPMVPGQRFDAPGKSPFMEMMLVPRYAGDDAADSGSVTVSPRIQQNLGLRTAEVVQDRLEPSLGAVGNIAWNERDQVLLQARTGAFVEKLHVRAALDRVAAGAPLVELYVPAWVAAQEEYLAVRAMQGSGLEPLRAAARQRMRLAGMDEAQIAHVETSGRVEGRFAVNAPISGTLTELMVREGMTVMPGMSLARIQGTGTVWAHAEVPESQAASLRPGQPVTATSPALPGQVFKGRVQALLPEVDVSTRTLKARLELANPGGRLVPGLFVQMQFGHAAARRVLQVPSEAVVHTGRRTVVMLAEPNGHFRPVTVTTGIEADGRTEIVSGLQAGQKVVLSALFLLDSEASLKGLEARQGPLSASGATAAASAPSSASAARAAATMHVTEAVVEAVDGDTVTLTHPAIAALKWPAMTMDFHLPAATRGPAALPPGERVHIGFELREAGLPSITMLHRMGPARPASAGGRP